MTLRAIFEAELARHGIAWCAGGCRHRNSHRRGFATAGTVHLDTAIGTRRTLYRGLHEVAHVVLGHTRSRRRHRWVVEAEAEDWTRTRMRALGVEPPAEAIQAGDAYVARMRRWGAAIGRANTGRRRAKRR
jgi:hypothetical protein